MTVRSDVWEDPAAWGILLADLTSTIAHGYQNSGDLPLDEVIARIISGFRIEMQSREEQA